MDKTKRMPVSRSSKFKGYFFPNQIILNVILNIAGVAFAITAIVLYILNVSDIYLWWICHDDYYYHRGTEAPVDQEMLQKCEEGVAMIGVSATNTSSMTARGEIQAVCQVRIDKPTGRCLTCVISIYPMSPLPRRSNSMTPFYITYIEMLKKNKKTSIGIVAT